MLLLEAIIQTTEKAICEACHIMLAISSTEGSHSRVCHPLLPSVSHLQVSLSGWGQRPPLPMSPLLPINPGKAISIPILPMRNNFV